MKRFILWLFLILITAAFSTFVFFWINTQPIGANRKTMDSTLLENLSIPNRNKEILKFIAAEGKHLSPTYKESVCTEFVIKTIEKFAPLSRNEKKDIRIIVGGDIGQFVQNDSPIVAGVQYALLSSGKGIKIEKSADVLPGDFVQFWNSYGAGYTGHCGVVVSVSPEQSITIYSSHPITDGFGEHTFLWPDKVYFVRMK